MSVTWKSELPVLLLLAFAVGLSLWAWPSVPERVPTHWGLDGRADGWGSRAVGLLISPAVGAFLYAMMLALSRLDPEVRANPATRRTLLGVRLAVIGFVTAMHATIVAIYLGAGFDIRSFVLPGLGALLIVIGGLIGRPGAGLVTGLRAEAVAPGAARLSGRLLVACGVLFLIAGVIRTAWAMVAAIVALGLAGLLAVIFAGAGHGGASGAPPGAAVGS